MSLLLSQVGAPPPPPAATPAVRIRGVRPDDGWMEARGVVRLGLVVAAVVAPVTFVAATIRAQQLPEPAVPQGRVTVAPHPPVAQVPIILRATILPDGGPVSGRITPGVVPPAPAAVVVWAPRVRSAVLPDLLERQASGVVRVGWSVVSVPVVPDAIGGSAEVRVAEQVVVSQLAAASSSSAIVYPDVQAQLVAAASSSQLVAAHSVSAVVSAQVEVEVQAAVVHDATLGADAGATLRASDSGGSVA